jgi:predicted nucleic acid-binding protein
MTILVDTNVLLRIAQANSPYRQVAKQALVMLDDAGIKLCLVPQVIYEFWVTATRPIDVNGLEMDMPSVEQSVEQLLRDFVLLRDERGIFPRWQSLVGSFRVQGKTAHDARLVAAMQRHGLTNLLTFNGDDFDRFPFIKVFTPPEVLAGQLPV